MGIFRILALLAGEQEVTGEAVAVAIGVYRESGWKTSR